MKRPIRGTVAMTHDIVEPEEERREGQRSEIAVISPNGFVHGCATDTGFQGFGPMHGILSLHGRKKATTWTCLVCGTSLPLVDKVCSTCNRDRIPPWLLDITDRTMFPGSIIRCARGAAEYAPSPPPVDPADMSTPPRSRGRSPSPVPGSPRAPRATVSSSPASPTRQLVPGGVGHHLQSPPRRSGQAGKPRVSPNPTSDPRRSAAPAKLTPSPKRGAQVAPENGDAPSAAGNGSPTAKKSGTPVGTPGTRRGGGSKVRGPTPFEAAAAAMKAEFEAEPSDCLVMVVAVNGLRPQPPRLPRFLEGYCIVRGNDGSNASTALVKVVIDTAKASSLQVVDPKLERQEYDKFLEFGLCGRCDRTYRIAQGWRHILPKPSKSTPSEPEAEIRRLEDLVAKTEERKKAFRATRDYKSTVEATETLKSLLAKIAAVRRTLEPVEMSCPFCLWRCAALFVAA